MGLDFDRKMLLSPLPKSVTAPVAMGDAWQIGGIPELAAPFAVVTGLSTAMSGKYIFAVANVDYSKTGWMVRGFALGTASHGIGTAGAMQVDA